ncbi:Rdx family protein [Kibdelosporangium aridum subsp. largum]|uniref:Rdx family protein n=1 Tax=Kibdelosporangium aridum TaxID=2030 RepID=UPI0035EB3D64
MDRTGTADHLHRRTRRGRVDPPGTGGVFDVRLDGDTLWSRAEQGGFAELAELKRLVRDRIAPDRDLGHTDRRAST